MTRPVCFTKEFRETLHETIRYAAGLEGSTRESVQRAVDSLVVLTLRSKDIVEVGNHPGHPMGRLPYNAALTPRANEALTAVVALALEKELTGEPEYAIVGYVNKTLRTLTGKGLALFRVVEWEEESCATPS